jgi:hypothetical protein
LSSHVDFLGALYVVWGAVTALIGLSTLALGVGAAALGQVARASMRGGVAADVAAGVFLILALLSMAWGLIHIVSGVALRRRRRWSRRACLALAILDLILLPYGTALGAYGLWVLLDNQVRHQFELVFTS